MRRILEVVEAMKCNGLANYIVAGLSSHMVGDGDLGGKVRLFSADRETRDTITPHSHRFDFACLVLNGYVLNTIYEPVSAGNAAFASEWVFSTIDQVCGVDGIRKYVHERETKPKLLYPVTTRYTQYDSYYMASDQVHSIVFSKGARVLFFEGPAKTTTSRMIEPWVNGRVVPTFKTEDWMFEKI